MTDSQFDAEKNYQAAMLCFRKLLDGGQITPKEYKQIDAMMLEKYRPTLGTLSSDITCYSPEKE